jgi:CheY-like chemotaxis protein
MRVRAEAKGLVLETAYAGPVPTSITTDPLRLKQILINLVGNAVKFTETGTVRVVVELVPPAEDEPKLRFDVVDTGVGMDERQVKRLFQPFVQADSSAARRFGGSGLGLAIVKRTAALLGGDVTVTSAPARGSTFSVTIATGPLDGAPGSGQWQVTTDRRAGLPFSPSPNCRVSPPTTPAKPPIRCDCRVLLAEDGPDNQRLITLVLRKAGASVTVVEDGGQVLEHALSTIPEPTGAPNHSASPIDNPSDTGANCFDVILMDMQMPVMDGYEATRRLRAAGYPGPIVALTAHAMKGDREKCIQAGCNDYVTKPIDLARLLEIVARYAAASRATSGLPEAMRDPR